jgi:hypothetical protein
MLAPSLWRAPPYRQDNDLFPARSKADSPMAPATRSSVAHRPCVLSGGAEMAHERHSTLFAQPQWISRLCHCTG